MLCFYRLIRSEQVVSESFLLKRFDEATGQCIPPIRAFTISVLSNYGNAVSTCFYRVKLVSSLVYEPV